jgi:DNA repair protein RadD
VELRPYQVELLGEVRGLMRQGSKSILIQSPTGSGKTVLTAHMLQSAAQKQMRSIFIVHRRELIKQSIKTFAKVGVPHGVIASGFIQEPHHPVQLASVQTLARRLEKLEVPELVLWDECHHIAAGGWARIREAFPAAYHIGLSATPERLDGTGLKKAFDQMIKGPDVSWLIGQGYLAPYKLFAPKKIDLTGVHSRMGDFVRSEVVSRLDKPTITGDVINEYLKLGGHKRAVIFASSIEHSKHVVSQFNAQGVKALHVDGETEAHLRDEAIQRFEEGEIKVLSNVDLFGEGFDLPALEAMLCLRPTESLSLWLQMCGRVLRTFPGKREAIILDFVGNCERHGLPCEKREWSLEGRRKKKSGLKEFHPVKLCPKCFAAQPSGLSACGHCGFEFEQKLREVAQVAGELIEVDAEVFKKKRAMERKSAQTYEDLVALGRARGYQRPEMWARFVYQGRMKKMRGGS